MEGIALKVKSLHMLEPTWRDNDVRTVIVNVKLSYPKISKLAEIVA